MEFSRISGRIALISFFIISGLFIIHPLESEAELLIHTQGIVSFAPYLHGIKETTGLSPGYRAEFLSQVDIFRKGNLIFSGLAGNMTMISRSDSSLFNLDKIRYTVSPACRYEFDTWFVKGVFHHESLYSISKSEKISGAYWQNSIRLGIGTKNSSFLYLPDKYLQGTDSPGKDIDAQCSVGKFLHGSKSIWVAKNHNYKYELLALIRYHAGSFHNWIASLSLSQHIWLKADKTTENKGSITLNLYRKGNDKLFGVYYQYNYYDTYTENNEDKLGAIGLRAIY
ncbi:hypothetical protein ACFL47_10080 [Candidatus Latescibacterota bacterium]